MMAPFCGAAGGIRVNNVGQVTVPWLMSCPGDWFWIDIESGVRDDQNHFSLQRAHLLLWKVRGTLIAEDSPSPTRATGVPPGSFRYDLEQLINTHSMENGSNTPDFVLANYIVGCIQAFDAAVQQRDNFYGVELLPGGNRQISRCRP